MFSCPLTGNAELRPLEHHHAEELFELIEENRTYLRRWLPEWDVQQSLDACRAMIKGSLDSMANNLGLTAGIWSDGRLAGVAGLGRIDWENRSSNLGYWLAETCQGKGLVTAACRAMINYAFLELKLKRLEIRCATSNPKSCAIPKRLGFRKEGVLVQSQAFDGTFLDIEVYGLLAEEWNPAPTSP
jgi:ribosomal-protein-serine acetyltransferase